jgi:hypothetical protein
MPSSGASDEQPVLTAEIESVTSVTRANGRAFVLRLSFSEALAAGTSYRSLRDHAFETSGGVIKRAKRVHKGQNDLWDITVRPDGAGDVSMTLGAHDGCEERHALCAQDDRPLSNSPMVAIADPTAAEPEVTITNNLPS